LFIGAYFDLHMWGGAGAC